MHLYGAMKIAFEWEQDGYPCTYYRCSYYSNIGFGRCAYIYSIAGGYLCYTTYNKSTFFKKLKDAKEFADKTLADNGYKTLPVHTKVLL